MISIAPAGSDCVAAPLTLTGLGSERPSAAPAVAAVGHSGEGAEVPSAGADVGADVGADAGVEAPLVGDVVAAAPQADNATTKNAVELLRRIIR